MRKWIGDQASYSYPLLVHRDFRLLLSLSSSQPFSQASLTVLYNHKDHKYTNEDQQQHTAYWHDSHLLVFPSRTKNQPAHPNPIPQSTSSSSHSESGA